MRVAVVSHRLTPTNLALAGRSWNGLPAEILSPSEALLRLGPGDAALGRLDVRDDLEGVEEGLWSLERLPEQGVYVLNRPAAVLRAHDKLLTARVLRRAGLPHPRTVPIGAGGELPDVDFPAVLKPRFGSWGKDVALCENRRDLERRLDVLATRSWFSRSGALVQELIPPLGHDLRLIVAGGKVVGAAKRIAAPGEWRTNVALGASVVPASPPPVASKLALAAAEAAGLDLVGIDLLPTGPGGFSVIELNGAVDFRPLYSFPGRDAYDDTVAALAGMHAAVAPEEAALEAGA
jgi:RimK family alpha-L-glutamate ligase